MKDCKENTKEVVECNTNPIDYRERIIGMVEKINNQGTLEYLYTFIKLFIEKWG